MSSDSVISVDQVSKVYQLYNTPADRLKQFLVPRFKRTFGAIPTNYYREFWALQDVSFEIGKGESVGILGRNGSGKSTLLQIVTGTLFPSSGTVKTRGRIAALLELGSGFNPEFTGRENVFLNGAILGLSRADIEAKFDSIASFADIGSHLEQPVKTYSSGMLIRLAFAVQVQLEPEILIVDEALAVGDALFQKRCFQRLHQMIDRGVTLLFVSHDQESVRTLTNRAILLRDGKMVAYGASADVVLEYRRQNHADECAYLAAVVGSFQKKEELQKTEPIEDEVDKESSKSSVKAFDAASNEFGGLGVKITKVEILNSSDEPNTVFHPGERIKIRICCYSSVDTDRLNVSVRIRNKEGVKIYSWGTLNQDMKVLSSGTDSRLFWKRTIGADEEFDVTLECDCSIGANLYEVQTCVSHEATPDYLNQTILHWMDEAAFFQVITRRDENFFGGVVDMGMLATWQAGGD